MSNTRKDSDFLNGVPELLLLKLLARQPMYGYELVQGIRLLTGGVLEFGEGSIYPILHRLVAEGVLTSTREAVGGRTRVVYRLTHTGQEHFATAAARWGEISSAISSALNGGQDATPTLA